jgi:hypothetical protein
MAVRSDYLAKAATFTTPESKSEPRGAGEVSAVTRRCAVCGMELKTKKVTAKCCSGKCRVILCRTRRLGDLVAKLEASQQALGKAETVLLELRKVVESIGYKVTA